MEFELLKAVIKEVSFPSLEAVAATLRAHPEIKKLSVEGHTDNGGKADENQRLSQARAEAVVRFLVGRGVDEARLEAHGYGAARPVGSNLTPAGRKANRRVELHILERAKKPAPSLE